MKKYNLSKCIITFMLLLCFTSLATAGGGGTPQLDTPEGLERAADNFLAAFALLTVSDDIKLTPINGVEGNRGFSLKVDLIEYEFDRSLWELYITDPQYSELTRSKDISSEEYRKFRNNYTLQRDLRIERDKNSANNSSVKNISKSNN